MKKFLKIFYSFNKHRVYVSYRYSVLFGEPAIDISYLYNKNTFLSFFLKSEAFSNAGPNNIFKNYITLHELF